MFLKQLAEKLTKKNDENYASVIIIRDSKSVHLSVRGSS